MSLNKELLEQIRYDLKCDGIIIITTREVGDRLGVETCSYGLSRSEAIRLMKEASEKFCPSDSDEEK